MLYDKNQLAYQELYAEDYNLWYNHFTEVMKVLCINQFKLKILNWHFHTKLALRTLIVKFLMVVV